MSSHTLSRSESLLHTERLSAEHGEVGAPPSKTFSTPAIVYKATFKSAASPLAEAHQDFDVLMAELEADDSNRAELAEAGSWVSEAFYKDDGDTLKNARLRLGLSQKQLALAIGTSQPHVANLERSGGDIMLSTGVKLCAALNIDFGKLPEMIDRQRAINANKEEN